MYYHNSNRKYTNYYYLPPSNTHYQYYNSHLHTLSPYTLPNFQHPYQPLTKMHYLNQPISVFDDQNLPLYQRPDMTTVPTTFSPSNLNRQSSISDARLAAAGAIREKLLSDIQQNMTEIDRELTSLEQRPSILALPYKQHYFSKLTQLTRPSFHQNTLPLDHDDSQRWSSKPRKAYQVIPQITSESKKSSQQVSPIHPIIGQFHYSSEVEDHEILENDPENSDRRSTIEQIPEFSSLETFSPNDFIREQSPLPQNRALTLVPQYVDNNHVKTNMTQSSTARSSPDVAPSNKLNIEDFQSLIQTASITKSPVISQHDEDSPKSPEKIEVDLMNTMLSKPVKHSHMSSRTEKVIAETENNTTDDIKYFFSEFGNEGDVEEDVISIDPNHFTLPNEAEMFSGQNNLSRQSQRSLKNPHSLQQQQSPVKKNNTYVKEKENKKVDATTKRIVINRTLPSQKIVPISITDHTLTQFTTNNNDEDQREISPFVLNENINEQSTENRSNTFAVPRHMKSTNEQPALVNKKSHSIQQRSSSQHSSKSSSLNILSRDRSISSTDLQKTPTNQSEH